MDHQFDDDMWSRVALECRRLAGLTTLEWMRAELLRSAAFYEKLGNGFGAGSIASHGQSRTKKPPVIASL
jgi:hypothetical protein